MIVKNKNTNEILDSATIPNFEPDFVGLADYDYIRATPQEILDYEKSQFTQKLQIKKDWAVVKIKDLQSAKQDECYYKHYVCLIKCIASQFANTATLQTIQDIDVKFDDIQTKVDDAILKVGKAKTLSDLDTGIDKIVNDFNDYLTKLIL